MFKRSRNWSPIRALFAVQIIFSVIFCFASLFLNVYLWDKGQSFRGIGIYNVFSVVSIFVGSILGAYFLQWIGSRATFIGSSVSALLLFSYLFFSNQATDYDTLPLLGILYGSYVGLFYIGFNLHLLWLTEKRNRSYLLGVESAIATAAQLLTPVCAGIMIANQGYVHTFLLILVLLCIQLLLSFSIPGIQMDGGYQKRYFFLAKSDKLARMGFSSLAYGFYFSFIQMSFGLFFYFIVKDEFQLGSWNLLFGAISAIMYWLTGRFLSLSNRDIFLSMGMLGTLIITLSLLLAKSSWFILFNIVIAVSFPLLWLPAKSTHFSDLITEAEKNPIRNKIGQLMQFLVFREFSISVGRLCFFLLLVVGFDFGLGYTYYFMVLLACVMPIGIWILNREILR